MSSFIRVLFPLIQPGKLLSLPHSFSTGGDSYFGAESPVPAPAALGVQQGALDELAQAGNAAVAQVSPWAGPREPARDQEPHVAATEDHQELLGHGLEGQERCQSRAHIQHPFLPASRVVLL